MRSIPPAAGTDAEDVVWALQTADALWRRRERIDAIVWLRRAAQAAGEAEDDDRALQLARDAAELAEWIARSPNSSRAPSTRTPPPTSTPLSDDVDDLVSVRPDELESDAPTPVRPLPVVSNLPSFPEPSMPPPRGRVPTAAEAHAGILDPWAEAEGLMQNGTPDDTQRSTAAITPPPEFETDEVVTSAPMVAAPSIETPSPFQAASPPIPPAARSAGRLLPPPLSPEPLAPPKAPDRAAKKADPLTTTRPDTPRAGLDARAARGTQQPALAPEPLRAPGNGIDLSNVEAFSNLPDDARAEFASAATVLTLARDDETTGFALALVLDGSVDLSSTIVDAAAQRLDAGAVLRARGTIDAIAPVRLVGAAPRSRVATWDEDAVTHAFRTSPWVEDELRAAGDLHQALVGITMGPLGDRLDPSLRSDVTNRLRLRALAEHEVIASRGDPVPGLVVVGAGELELLDEHGAPNGSLVRPGEFLFPTEALRAARAPNTVRAARGGALVLMAERGATQELLITCPPLLEIFAGM